MMWSSQGKSARFEQRSTNEATCYRRSCDARTRWRGCAGCKRSAWIESLSRCNLLNFEKGFACQ